MESAVYLAATNKVYGVRGQWIYECDPASGSVVRSGRFCDNVVFGSNIVAVGAKVYVGVVYSDRWNFNTSLQGIDIFSIDPTALPFPTATALGLDSKLAPASPPFPIEPGWNWLTEAGGFIFGWTAVDGIFLVDPTNTATYSRHNQNQADGVAIDSLSHVGFFASHYIWLTDGRANNIHVWASDFLDDTTDTGGVTTLLGGITLCNSTAKVYAVKGTEDFYKVDANAPFVAPPSLSNFAVGTLHLNAVPGPPVVVNPQPSRIRACNVIGNPYFGKVLIPTMKGDQVIVWDSASDLPANAVVKTGFSAPYDIVYTPTGAMAIQNSSVGVKPIT